MIPSFFNDTRNIYITILAGIINLFTLILELSNVLYKYSRLFSHSPAVKFIVSSLDKLRTNYVNIVALPQNAAITEK